MNNQELLQVAKNLREGSMSFSADEVRSAAVRAALKLEQLVQEDEHDKARYRAKPDPEDYIYEDSRDQLCVAAWPECHSGGYDPRCCRFPKSCSAG